MNTSRGKLYLCMMHYEESDEIVAVRNNLEECVEFFDKNPDKIVGSTVIRVEAHADPVQIPLIPNTFVATEWNVEKHEQVHISSPLLDEQMLQAFLDVYRKMYPYHHLGEYTGAYRFFRCAATAEDFTKNGKCKFIRIETLTVRFDE